jgi:hypothetical protein
LYFFIFFLWAESSLTPKYSKSQLQHLKNEELKKILLDYGSTPSGNKSQMVESILKKQEKT